VFTEGGTGARHINGILSLLIKEYYPGLVTIDGIRKPPMKWEHFHLHTVPVPEPEGGDHAGAPAREPLAEDQEGVLGVCFQQRISQYYTFIGHS
jgi:hypothetical protein